MGALSRGCFTFLIVVSFAVTSSANWNWIQTKTGNYYAVVQDGDCSSGVTVYFKQNDWYGTGWRAAFDNHRFRNLNLPTPQAAMAAAERLFYSDYCGTENYQPSCPPGSSPLSQRVGYCIH